MKKTIFFSVFVLCTINVMFAQQKFNVQNGVKTEFYSSLEEAIQKAVAGDTIYLPGALIEVQNDIIIDKKLALIGAGCDTDSIGGLKRTELRKGTDPANINFTNGSNGSLLMGCVVNDITFGHRDEANNVFQEIENITISRNIFYQIILGIESTVQNPNKIKNIFIQENFGTGISGVSASNCWINNNLLLGRFMGWSGTIYPVSSLNNSYIYNNVMPDHGLRSLNACIIENNYIANEAVNTDHGHVNCAFNNNAFKSNFTFPVGTNTGINNLMNQDPGNTFEENLLNLPKNLDIKLTSPCKNAGTDGTDIGIFGGSTPYKRGAIPLNPHIDKSIISAQTDAAGNLKIEIKVSAQDR